jgi:hypothetical protein
MNGWFTDVLQLSYQKARRAVCLRERRATPAPAHLLCRVFFSAAHRFLWAAAIRFLPAKLILGRGLAGAWAARFLGPSMALTWAIY